MSLSALLLALGLLLGNALFVSAEFALVSARRTQLEPLARAGDRRARNALTAMSQVSLVLAGSQFGITICSLLLGHIAEPAIAHGLEGPFQALGMPEELLHPIAFVIALTLVVSAHMVIGEMVPKNIALATPERAALWLATPMLWFMTLTKPVLLLLNRTANGVLRLSGVQPTDEVKTVYTADELANLVAQSRTEGLLDAEAHARITGALTLQRRTAREVLLPWSRVWTVTTDTSPASLEILAYQTGRSRFPVVERDTRRIIGFVHVKDVIGITGAARAAPLPESVIRPLTAVPPERTLADLLLHMRRNRRHIAVVAQEGRPLGIVTLEDVLTAVVGASADLH